MNPSSAPGESPIPVGGVVTSAAGPWQRPGEDHQIHQLVVLDQRGQGVQPQELEKREREMHNYIKLFLR